MGLSKEETVAIVVILGFCVVAAYQLVLWVMTATRTADPWDEEIDKAINQADAVPLCHHCLAPQQHNGWFCHECGATVGPYCNYLPYVNVFSQGEMLRAGVTERFRHKWFIVVGYVLISLSMFAIAAPFYWFFLFKNLRRSEGTEA